MKQIWHRLIKFRVNTELVPKWSFSLVLAVICAFHSVFRFFTSGELLIDVHIVECVSTPVFTDLMESLDALNI